MAVSVAAKRFLDNTGGPSCSCCNNKATGKPMSRRPRRHRRSAAKTLCLLSVPHRNWQLASRRQQFHYLLTGTRSFSLRIVQSTTCFSYVLRCRALPDVPLEKPKARVQANDLRLKKADRHRPTRNSLAKVGDPGVDPGLPLLTAVRGITLQNHALLPVSYTEIFVLLQFVRRHLVISKLLPSTFSSLSSGLR